MRKLAFIKRTVTHYSASHESMSTHCRYYEWVHTSPDTKVLSLSSTCRNCQQSKLKLKPQKFVVVAVSDFQGRHQPLLLCYYKVYICICICFFAYRHIYCSTRYAWQRENCCDLRNLSASTRRSSGDSSSNWKGKQKLKTARGAKEFLDYISHNPPPTMVLFSFELKLLLPSLDIAECQQIYLKLYIYIINLKEKQKFLSRMK